MKKDSRSIKRKSTSNGQQWSSIPTIPIQASSRSRDSSNDSLNDSSNLSFYLNNSSVVEVINNVAASIGEQPIPLKPARGTPHTLGIPDMRNDDSESSVLHFMSACESVHSRLDEYDDSGDMSDSVEEYFPFKKICGLIPNDPNVRFEQNIKVGKALTKTIDQNIPYHDKILESPLKEKERSNNVGMDDANINRMVDNGASENGVCTNEDDFNESIESDCYSPIPSEIDHEVQRRNRHRILDVNGGQIVTLEAEAALHVFGFLSLTLLRGSIEINGYTLKTTRSYELFSPRGSAFLSIRATSQENSTPVKTKADYVRILHEFGVPYTTANETLENLKPNDAIFFCTTNRSTKMDFIELYVSQKLFPIFADERRFQFSEEARDWNILRSNDRWDNVLKGVSEGFKVLLCGGKSVGKSSMLRYLCNRLLATYTKVLVLDLDPGQPEFTVPGCISATIVEEPLLGPNYTHLKKPERCIFLHVINTARWPQHYISSVEALLKSCEDLKGFPILVNTMGFTRGLGVPIFASVVAMVKPERVVEIYSKKHSKNFAEAITFQNVEQQRKLFTKEIPPAPFEVVNVSAMSDFNSGWELEARQVREMCILSYLSEMLPDGVLSLNDPSVPLYECDLGDISLVKSKEMATPADLFAQLVGLCNRKDDKSDVLECHGWGIVRGINVSEETLGLLTPVNMEENEGINCLAVGAVSLPPSIYMGQSTCDGHIPYVQVGNLTGFTQMSKRSHIPAKRH